MLVIGTVLALLGSGGYLVMLELMPSVIVYAPNTDRSIDPARDPVAGELRRLGVTRQARVEVGPPAASLSCWIVDPPRGKPRGTVLVLHGIRDRKRSMLGLGRRLADAGYRAVLPDHRGHGRSSGRWLTFGVVESRDMVQLLDRLEATGQLVRPVGALGFSYGAAVALQAAGRDPRLVAVVSVAAFSSMQSMVGDYIRAYASVLGPLLPEANIRRAVRQAGAMAGFDPVQASPLRAIRRGRARVLLVHGAEDRKIPAWHARALHEAAPRRSELMILEGKNHNTTLADRGGDIAEASMRFLERWMRPGAVER
jgi:pimeloyl-ACP methyl ester carboxylesterase